MAPLSGVPAVPAAALPADVRRAPKADQDAYKAALGFERLLVSQLVKAAMPEHEEAGPYAGAVTDGFADALMHAGGLGLARQIHAGLGERTR